MTKAPFKLVIFVVQLDATFVVLPVTSSFKHVQNFGNIAATKLQVVYTHDFEVATRSALQKFHQVAQQTSDKGLH